MGKRSDFERNDRDYYPTPYKAIIPLINHLPKKTLFIEPCAGDGRLIKHLQKHGHECVYACDIEPQAEGIEKKDILFFNNNFPACDFIITNTPWDRDVLHKMILLFRSIAPAWLLLDADYAYTNQSTEFMAYCQKIVPVGRVQWIEDSNSSGMDNASWYLFDQQKYEYSKFYRKK